ncbi:MAG: replication-associated recombination protein A [Bacteroidetes bacterium]|nr:replication-associated recombination protein A [Bacteroidota bacterium]
MQTNIPLAERLRPKNFEEYIGQKHLLGKEGVLAKMLTHGNIPSFILWGPPGIGKTTLANIVALTLGRPFYTLSAINSGVKDIRDIIEKAKDKQFFNTQKPILFIDEIHRFSKSQQDSLLGAVEQGIFTLIGATTENPSFEVIRPLLSRCQVYILNPLSLENIKELVERALTKDVILKEREIEIKEYEALYRFSGGDARKLLNILDIISNSEQGKIIVTNEFIEKALKDNIISYDKGGEQHYDYISAFIKSIRGSDPNASIYYLAMMLNAGEDVKFIARRLIISASEDIGLANPNSLLIANACFDAVSKIGMPEARIPLAEATIYLATSAKSNSAYLAINKAMSFIKKDNVPRPVPLNLRNAPTALLKDIGYGGEYKYSHDFKNHFVYQEFMPQGLEKTTFYEPQHNSKEEQISRQIENQWKDKYK